MSNNDYILNLLNIKGPNIFSLNNSIKNKVIKGKNHKIIEAILSYNPSHCPCCGTINDSTNDIIKWGFRKNCKIKIPNISNCRSLLLLHKQRFYCKHCYNTFLSETNLVDKYKNISNNSELQIRVELTKKQSEKDIADRVNVSTSKINRVLNDISSKTLLRHPCLPINMNWDEFKRTYECYQCIINSIKHKDFTKFKNIIYNQEKYLPNKMKKDLKLLEIISNILKIHLNMTSIMALLKAQTI